MDIISGYGLVFLALACVFGLFMAWGIGANDVANAMGTSVGSHRIRDVVGTDTPSHEEPEHTGECKKNESVSRNDIQGVMLLRRTTVMAQSRLAIVTTVLNCVNNM